MSLPQDSVLISADDHLDIHAMPPDIWSSRLPREWRDRGPHVAETLEGPTGSATAGALPSEIFARQVLTTYEDEKLGVELLPRIGIGNVMWASDYLHGDSTWPHPRKALAESALAQHGPEVLRNVTCANAAPVYGFQM
jgi:hypothetical protein